MLVKNHLNRDKLDQVPTRNGFGKGLVIAGEENEKVVALCADLTESTRIEWFKEKFPERFIEVGVAEQNLATVAAGMAAAGKIPFIASYATFSPGRNWEQIRTTVCLNDVPVKVLGAHAGVSVGPDGATHQALEDIAIMRVLPRMTVLVPCDAVEAEKATIAAARLPGPVYIRVGRSATPVFTTPSTPFEVGKLEEFNKGKDVTIIGCGLLVYEALQAAQALKKDGVSAQVLNCHTIKPFDRDGLIRAVRVTGAVVTAEEHQKTGGLGSCVAEVIGESYPVPLERVGIDDRFGESGRPDELVAHFELDAKAIIKAVEKVLKRKK